MTHRTNSPKNCEVQQFKILFVKYWTISFDFRFDSKALVNYIKQLQAQFVAFFTHYPNIGTITFVTR